MKYIPEEHAHLRIFFPPGARKSEQQQTGERDDPIVIDDSEDKDVIIIDDSDDEYHLDISFECPSLPDIVDLPPLTPSPVKLLGGLE